MDTDVEKLAKLAEIKKQLEEIAGRKTDLSAEQLLTVSFPIASSTLLTSAALTLENDDAWITNERIGAILPVFCTDCRLLDTSGSTETGTDGKDVFLLSNFLCNRLGGISSFAEPVNLLATPRGASPTYVTMTHELIKDPAQSAFTDVRITAFSWNSDGTSAPNVRFYWRCRVATITIFP
jgi:hypothetical protein